MRAQIKKQELLGLLGPAQGLVEKRGVIPILSKILMEVDGSQLKIFVTDQENSLQGQASIEKAKKGRACVDAQNFFSIVKELPEGLIELSKPEKKWALKIKTKRADFNMVGVDPEDFPVFPTLKNPPFFKMKSVHLKKLIESTSYCVSMDETRYHLNGVLCEEKKKKTLRFVATDGHRLSFAEQAAPHLNIPEGVIIPRKGLAEISRLLSEEDEQVQMAVKSPRALFSCGPFLLSVRLIEGKYPNYAQLIPKESKIRKKVRKEELSSALKRVSILSSFQSRNVHFSWREKEVVLTAQHPDLGDAEESLPLLESKGGKLDIRFNARYVLEALGHISEEEVVWEMNTASSPGVIRTPASSGVCVIMPMKL